MTTDGNEAMNETKELAPAPPGHRWYVIHTYSGYETKVKNSLMERMAGDDYTTLIGLPLIKVVDFLAHFGVRVLG